MRNSTDRGMKIFSGNANIPLARAITARTNVSLGERTVDRFSNSEIQVMIDENVRGYDTFVIQTIAQPVNDNLMELLLLVDTLRRASARRITAVIPYYGYARQDRKTRGREPISAKLVANLITVAGARRVLTMDLHAGQIQGFFDIPVDNLTAIPILADYFDDLDLVDPIVVSPDVGGVVRAREMANRLDLSLAIIDKRRPEPNVSEVVHIIGESVQGRTAILIDDMIDTAGTMCEAARALLDAGARAVYAAGTHGLFSGQALERLAAAPIDEIVVTDTLPVPDEGPLEEKLSVLSIGPLMGEAIVRIHEDLSVSKLFK